MKYTSLDVPLKNLLHDLRHSSLRPRARIPVYYPPFSDGTPNDKLAMHEYDVMEEAARRLEEVFDALLIQEHPR